MTCPQEPPDTNAFKLDNLLGYGFRLMSENSLCLFWHLLSAVSSAEQTFTSPYACRIVFYCKMSAPSQIRLMRYCRLRTSSLGSQKAYLTRVADCNSGKTIHIGCRRYAVAGGMRASFNRHVIYSASDIPCCPVQAAACNKHPRSSFIENFFLTQWNFWVPTSCCLRA